MASRLPVVLRPLRCSFAGPVLATVPGLMLLLVLQELPSLLLTVSSNECFACAQNEHTSATMHGGRAECGRCLQQRFELAAAETSTHTHSMVMLLRLLDITTATILLQTCTDCKAINYPPTYYYYYYYYY